MKQATLSQIFALAWISAQAFTQRRPGTGKWAAIAAYPVHLVMVLMATMDGDLYHDSSQAMVVIRNRRATPLKGALAFGLLVVLFFLPAIPLAAGYTQTSIFLLLAFEVVVGIIFVISAVSVLPHHGPGTSPAALRKAMNAAAHGGPAVTFELLARTPKAQPGAGAKLLTQAIDELAGQGAVVGCIAANMDLIPFYNRFGLQQIGQTQLMLNPAWDTSGRRAEK